MIFLPKIWPWNKPHILPWIILLFAAVNKIFIGGNRRAFGSFVAEFRKEYRNVTLSELNWIGDSYAAVGYLCSSLSTMLILYFHRRYDVFQFIGAVLVMLSCIASSFIPNPHWLFITHTIFNGIGSSLVISIVGLVVNEHFNKDHPFHLVATTLIAGGPVASIIFVPTYAFLIQKYNWRMAFVILGIIYFTMYGSAAIFFKKNKDIDDDADKITISCHCNEIALAQFPLLALWFVDRVLTSVVTYGLILNLTDYIYRVHPNLVRSSILTTLYSAGEGFAYVIGAITTAATKNFFKNKLKFILLVSSLIASLSLIGMEFANQAIARQLLCFLTGLSMGPSNMFIFPGGEELTRLPGHIAYPFSLAGLGIGTILSPLLTAKLAEMFMYKWFFLAQGCLIFIKVICILVITLMLIYCKVYSDDSEYNGLLSKSEVLEISKDDKDDEDETKHLLPDDVKRKT